MKGGKGIGLVEEHPEIIRRQILIHFQWERGGRSRYIRRCEKANICQLTSILYAVYATLE